MGWMEGLLTGYMGARHADEQRQYEEAVAGNAREATVYQSLLSSPDPEIRAMAATGMLQSTQPRKKTGGLRGWMGEMQGNAVYPKLLQYLNTPQQVGEDVDTHVTTPQSAGYLPTLPPSNAPAAQSATQTTTPGAAPPVGSAPLPQASPAPGPVGAAPPMPVPPAQPPQGDVPPGLAEPPPPPEIPQTQGIDLAARAGLPPKGAAAQPESLRTTTRTPVYGLPHAFPTAADTAYAATSAKDQAEYDNLVQVGRRAGQPEPEKWAAQLIAANKQHSMGVHEGDSRPATSVEAQRLGVPEGAYVQDLYDNTGRVVNTIPAAAKTGGRQMSKRAEIGINLFGDKYGFGQGGVEDPEAFLRRLTPKEHGILLREEGIIDAQAKLRQAEQAADAPLSRVARMQLADKLNTKWETRNKAQREMQRQVGLMDVGLKNLSKDPLGATQAVLVTFQKILDPTSVVRESEYDRSSAGLAVIPRLQGFYERYVGKGWDPQTERWIGGGAGVPEADLKAMADTARQFLESMSHYNDTERQRISDFATDNGIDPDRYVFGGNAARSSVGGPPPALGASAAPAVGSAAPPVATLGKNAQGQTTIIIK